MKNKLITLVFMVLFTQFVSAGCGQSEFPLGQVVEKVVCKLDASQSYALYLPSTYTAEKQYPILYCFEPAARGTLPITLFQAAAEKYGYIVVCSNTSRNGPWAVIDAGGKAMWNDTIKRFSIDPKRIYATGFSGGSRAASHFMYMIKRPITGVIGCGAGLSTRMKPELMQKALYFGTVGLEDFNFREMTRLDKAFDKTEVVHYLRVMDGGHRWPPQEVCMEAVEWMELMGMKRGTRKKDVLMAIKLYKKTLQRAQALEASPKIMETVRAYEGAAQLFDSLVDVSEAKRKADQLRNSKGYKSFLKDERRRYKKEMHFLKESIQIKRILTGPNPPKSAARLLKPLGLAALHKEANKEDNKVDVYDRALARRLLYEMRVNITPQATAMYRQKNFKQAALLYDLAYQAGSTHPVLIYNLACSYALAKNKKKALKMLKISVEKGFNNLKQINTDTDLDTIRNEKAFKQILTQMEANQN